MDRGLGVKYLGEIGGAAISAITGVLAVGESTTLTAGAIVAVLGFAGLLVRQVVQSQQAIWQIVAAKDAEKADLQDTIHYLQWELESMRFRHGERQVDPGPFIPRRRPIQEV